MSWMLLIVAGLLEVAWASVLPNTDGLTRLVPSLVFAVLLGGSMFLLARATDSIPIGTAYAVWVGIGAAGTAVVGMALHGDAVSPARIGFLAMLVIAIMGMKLTGAQ